MKKLASAILAVTLVVGIAAPSFAWDVNNCPFTNKSMCEPAYSLVDSSED